MTRYVERGTHGPKGVNTIQVSTTTVANTVGGRYEWKVANYKTVDSKASGSTRKKTTRTLIWDDMG